MILEIRHIGVKCKHDWANQQEYCQVLIIKAVVVAVAVAVFVFVFVFLLYPNHLQPPPPLPPPHAAFHSIIYVLSVLCSTPKFISTGGSVYTKLTLF